MKNVTGFILLLVLIAGCKKEVKPIIKEFTFETDAEGWTVGYSDYPSGLTTADSIGLYEMTYGYTQLPAEIVPARSGMRIRGSNRSDDLFMYLKKKITGLSPGTVYKITYEIELASNAPTNAVGIGGAPGEGVILKAGASATEPVNVVDNEGWYRLNIDKGNQTENGEDMVVLGNIGVTDNTTQYAMIKRTSGSDLLAESNDAGELWAIAGTDSGYEGITELYFSGIKIRLEEF